MIYLLSSSLFSSLTTRAGGWMKDCEEDGEDWWDRHSDDVELLSIPAWLVSSFSSYSFDDKGSNLSLTHLVCTPSTQQRVICSSASVCLSLYGSIGLASHSLSFTSISFQSMSGSLYLVPSISLSFIHLSLWSRSVSLSWISSSFSALILSLSLDLYLTSSISLSDRLPLSLFSLSLFHLCLHISLSRIFLSLSWIVYLCISLSWAIFVKR